MIWATWQRALPFAGICPPHHAAVQCSGRAHMHTLSGHQSKRLLLLLLLLLHQPDHATPILLLAAAVTRVVSSGHVNVAVSVLTKVCLCVPVCIGKGGSLGLGDPLQLRSPTNTYETGLGGWEACPYSCSKLQARVLHMCAAAAADVHLLNEAYLNLKPFHVAT